LYWNCHSFVFYALLLGAWPPTVASCAFGGDTKSTWLLHFQLRGLGEVSTSSVEVCLKTACSFSATCKT
jgi:hypothetical protein